MKRADTIVTVCEKRGERNATPGEEREMELYSRKTEGK